ncbi:MAG: hypothetical protein R3B72_36095 [Polyangiaceae bacterium]
MHTLEEPMHPKVLVAVVAGVAAIVGALVSALTAFFVERLRAVAATRLQAAEQQQRVREETYLHLLKIASADLAECCSLAGEYREEWRRCAQAVAYELTSIGARTPYEVVDAELSRVRSIYDRMRTLGAMLPPDIHATFFALRDLTLFYQHKIEDAANVDDGAADAVLTEVTNASVGVDEKVEELLQATLVWKRKAWPTLTPGQED